MSDWDFECPRYRDFCDPRSLEDSNPDAYFDNRRSSIAEMQQVVCDAVDTAHLVQGIPEQSQSEGVPSEEKENVEKSGSGASSKAEQAPARHEKLRSRKALKQRNLLDNPIKASKPGSPYKSLAEKVVEYHRKTPLRFRTVSALNRNKQPHGTAQAHRPRQPTTPKMPQLKTRLRSRAVTKQDDAATKVKGVKRTSAKPAAHKTVQDAVAPLHLRSSSVPPAEPTVSLPNSKPQHSTLAGQPDMAATKLIAQPAPLKVQKKTELRQVKKASAVTIPQSPAFALKERSKLWKEKGGARLKEPAPKAKSQMVKQKQRSSSVPGRLHSTLRLRSRSTTPELFSFQKQQEESLLKKRERIEQAKSKSQGVTTFYARPAPGREKVFCPKKVGHPLTEKEPFNPLSEARHLENLKAFQTKMDKLQKEARSSRKFKARPCLVTHQPPFQTALVATYTVAEDIMLHSETRAEQRQHFNTKLLEEAKRREAKEAAAEKERLLNEAEEIKMARKVRVHKAKPMPKYSRKAMKSPVPGPSNPQAMHQKVRRAQR